ncbi:MAG: chemotaxis protein CheA [Nitrospirae bacterium]|nr:MAG: chemotaxis protein CheA [Nitrospirota bacterium]
MAGEMDEILQDFIVETTEILEGLDEKFIELEKSQYNTELINDIFRAVHTIKGAAGFLGLNQMVDLSHAAENVLKKLRDSVIGPSPEVIDVILESVDKLKILLEKVKNNDQSPEDIEPILKRLKDIDEGKIPPSDQPPSLQKTTTEEAQKTSEDAQSSNQKSDVKKEPTERVNVERTLRVDIERLDTVFNLVGELVLGKNRLSKIASQLADKYPEDPDIASLNEASEFLQLLSSELQTAVMKTRMQPVKKVFNRFPRMVRDLARSHGKEIELIIKGEETEVDKSVIENIADPLVHLIRNAIDHGIEPPEERKKLGKPEKGRIVLSAFQEGNNIVIVVVDDGRGLNLEKIKEKAIEKAIISKEEAEGLNDREIAELIFQPGFSTADRVTDVSGRGVGMDVVKTNLAKINGSIDVLTQQGKGVKFTIKLPLTLAIIQTLMIEVSNMVFAVPITSVLEAVRIDSSEISRIDEQEVIKLRGEILPIVRLKELIGSGGNGSKNQYVVVVQSYERKFGLVVDGLLGQDEVVIKSVEGNIVNLNESNIFAGATITGEGKVVLIVDIPALMEYINKDEELYV